MEIDVCALESHEIPRTVATNGNAGAATAAWTATALVVSVGASCRWVTKGPSRDNMTWARGRVVAGKAGESLVGWNKRDEL